MQELRQRQLEVMDRMIKRALIVAGLFLAAVFAFGMVDTEAHADYYNYPCNYPFVGTSASVDVLIYAGGQYCDGPMEINGSHYHCESAGGGISGGGIGLAPIGGINLGAFGGSGIGGAGGRCAWRCPDNTNAPPPNPPAAWIKRLVIDPKNNDCRDHMAPAGADSAPQPGAVPEGPPPPAPDTPDEGSIIQPGSPMPLP